MATKVKPDERVVYLALRHHFLQHGKKMKLGKIRSKVQSLSTSSASEVQSLMQAHSVEHIAQVAQSLFAKGIFQSTEEAKKRFPELFEVSPAQSAERAASEFEATRNEDEALQEAAHRRQRAEQPMPGGDVIVEPNVADQSLQALLPKGKQRAVTVTSLYPAYLPLSTQHKLMVESQAILESACFDYGVARFPGIMAQQCWDCAESVELNEYVKVLRNHKFSTEVLGELGKPLKDVLDTMIQLRHTAVHRVRVTAGRVQQFLADAEMFSKLLRDDRSSASLAQLRRSTTASIEEMKRSKDLLESRIVGVRKEYAQRIASLQRQEESAISEILDEDGVCQQVIGESLVAELRRLKADLEVSISTAGSGIDLDNAGDESATEADIAERTSPRDLLPNFDSDNLDSFEDEP